MTLAARTIITNLRATLGFSAHGGSVFRCLLGGFFRTAIIAFLTLRTRRAFRLRTALLTLTTLTVISAFGAFRTLGTLLLRAFLALATGRTVISALCSFRALRTLWTLAPFRALGAVVLRGLLDTAIALLAATTVAIIAIIPVAVVVVARRTVGCWRRSRLAGRGFGKHRFQPGHQPGKEALMSNSYSGGNWSRCFRAGCGSGGVRCDQFDGWLLDLDFRFGDRLLRRIIVFQQVDFMTDQTFADLIVTDALHFKMRGVQIRVRNNQDARFVAVFQITQLLTLFIQHVGAHRHRHLRLDFPGALLHHFFFDQPQDRQSQ